MPVSPFHFGYTCAYCGRFFPGLNRLDLAIVLAVTAVGVWMALAGPRYLTASSAAESADRVVSGLEAGSER